MLKPCITLLLMLLIAGCMPYRAGLSPFSGDLAAWEHHGSGKATRYEAVERDGRTVLRAHSRLSASALYKAVEIDLQDTPYLNWSWRIEKTLGELDEQTRWGDDFAARVYVMLSPGTWDADTRALCYVWASNTPSGGHWPSPAGNNVIVIGMENRGPGRWVTEKRNVLDDVRKHFGAGVRRIEGVAVMTDTDDSKSETTAYYGDIFLQRIETRRGDAEDAEN